jgi:hypothetical protein
LKELKQRRTNELEMLTYLTGKGYNDWDVVYEQPEEKYVPKEASYAAIAPTVDNKPKRSNGILYATFGIVGLISLAGISRRRQV